MSINKLHAYGLDVTSWNLLQDYLSNREQSIKVDSFLNSWEDTLSGVQQSSIPGPLSFNIFTCDMSLILKTVYFTDYAVDSTSFAIADKIKDVPHHIETSQLICNANQLSGFYMLGKIGR